MPQNSQHLSKLAVGEAERAASLLCQFLKHSLLSIRVEGPSCGMLLGEVESPDSPEFILVKASPVFEDCSVFTSVHTKSRDFAS